MSRRHPNVVNIKELPDNSQSKGSRFGCLSRGLGMATGATRLGCSFYEIAKGKTAYPSHYHTANEESLFVLEGKGRLRIGDAWIDVGPGDYATFPVGPEYSHQIENNSDAPLRYLCFSTLVPVEVVGYPDSKKVGLRVAGPDRSAPPALRYLFKTESAVDYYEGEDTGE